MSDAIKKVKAADESGVIDEYPKALKVEEVEKETKRIDEWNLEWSRYPERVQRE